MAYYYVKAQVDRYDDVNESFLRFDVDVFDVLKKEDFKESCYQWLSDYVMDLPLDDYEITFFLKEDGDYLGNMFYDITKSELEFLHVFKSKICKNHREE